MAGGRFVVRFPCIRLREELGGQRALVFMSAKPKGGDDNLVIATVMDQQGRLHGNIPVSLQAIKYAAERDAVTLVEVDERLSAPTAGLVGLDGKPLLR